MRRYLFFLFVICISHLLSAQDVQFSQYYNAPLYLNPAFAGSAENTRAILNHRIQWPSIQATTPYVTTAFSFDHNIESINSGIGLLFTRDRQGIGKLTSSDLGLFYSYQVRLSSAWSFIPGIQASIVSRTVDYGNILFGDQISETGPNNTPTQDELVAGKPTRLYPDFSTGGLIYSDVVWFGLSAHHLNRPDQSFLRDGFRLPVKTSIQAGLRLPIGSQRVSRGYKEVDVERSLLPSLNFKSQGKFNQLDLGVQLIYEPIMLGLWYRGIPVKKFEGVTSHESVVLLAGVHAGRVSFGYSYDVTISQLSINNSGGAHEISLIYEWSIPYRTKKKGRPLPCPKFYRHLQKPAPQNR